MRRKPTRLRPGTQADTSQADDPRAAGSHADDDAAERQRVLDADLTWAAFGYLGALFLGPVIPLAVYLIRRRGSPFIRYHAATALNLSFTAALYGLCCVIVGGLLLLDSLTVALVVALPLGFALWLCLLNQLIRGLGAANRGERYEPAGWICAPIAR
jgi:uncharacterized Tic20 family protein